MTKVRLSGGGAQSPFWHQLFADIFDRRVVTLQTQEGSAYGAALLALVGTGEYKSARKCAQRGDQGSGNQEPEPERRRVLRARVRASTVRFIRH